MPLNIRSGNAADCIKLFTEDGVFEMSEPRLDPEGHPAQSNLRADNLQIGEDQIGQKTDGEKVTVTMLTMLTRSCERTSQSPLSGGPP